MFDDFCVQFLQIFGISHRKCFVLGFDFDGNISEYDDISRHFVSSCNFQTRLLVTSRKIVTSDGSITWKEVISALNHTSRASGFLTWLARKRPRRRRLPAPAARRPRDRLRRHPSAPGMAPGWRGPCRCAGTGTSLSLV